MEREPSFVKPEIWGDEHFAYMKKLREEDPVHWSESDKIWLVTKFNDVAYASKHQELFTSADGVLPGLPAKIGMIDDGEPRHSQLRKFLSRGFTPRMVIKLEEQFRQKVTETLDRIGGKGESDFTQDIAVPLPLQLIADMIGINPEDREQFHRWSDTMIAAIGRMDDLEAMFKSAMALTEYAAYLNGIIEDRRANPKDDLISILVNVEGQGVIGQFEEAAIPKTPYPDELYPQEAKNELVMLMVLLLVAGNETTRNGISGGMQLLIENSDQRERLIREPGLMKSAIEEMLRLVSPVQSFCRTVTEDTELGGKHLKKGEKILLLYPSANRDAEAFENPEKFDIARNPNNHIAFGLGSHFCLGANLARMEMRVVFEEVLKRLPDMKYAVPGDKPTREPNALVRSVSHMRLRFSPERR